MSVHKKFIEVEQDFNQLNISSDHLDSVKQKFLELPYMLRPIFDLMKDYEQQGVGIENTQNLKLESVLSEIKELQKGLSLEDFVFDDNRSSERKFLKAEIERINNEEASKFKRNVRRNRTDAQFI